MMAAALPMDGENNADSFIQDLKQKTLSVL